MLSSAQDLVLGKAHQHEGSDWDPVGVERAETVAE